MGYLIFRGVSTNSLGDVAVQQMPDHRRASKRMTEYYVAGRDGVLHIDEGFDNFDLTVRLVLLKASVSKRQVVNAWADGTGKLISSDDLTRCYRATVKDEIIWSRTQANGGFYDTAEITFNCEPYMYEAVESAQEFTQGGNIVNPGTAESLPLIKAEGEGTCDFRIGNTEEYYIILYDMDAGTPVYIDSETGYVYAPDGTTKTMVGNFPVLEIGNNPVVFGQNGLTKLTITPRWRWV